MNSTSPRITRISTRSGSALTSHLVTATTRTTSSRSAPAVPGALSTVPIRSACRGGRLGRAARPEASASLIIRPCVRAVAEPAVTIWPVGQIGLLLENRDSTGIDMSVSIRHCGSDWSKEWEFDLPAKDDPFSFAGLFDPPGKRSGDYELGVNAAGVPLVRRTIRARRSLITRRLTSDMQASARSEARDARRPAPAGLDARPEDGGGRDTVRAWLAGGGGARRAGGLRQLRGARGRGPDRGRRRDRRGDRGQRRGQVDAAVLPGGAAPAGGRDGDRARRPAARRRGVLAGGRAGRRPADLVPGAYPAGAPGACPADPRAGPGLVPADGPAHRGVRAARAGRTRSRSTCPPASGSGCRWRPRWPGPAGCCCSTSRSRASTPGSARNWRACCANTPGTAGRRSWPPTTSTSPPPPGRASCWSLTGRW